MGRSAGKSGPQPYSPRKTRDAISRPPRNRRGASDQPADEAAGNPPAPIRDSSAPGGVSRASRTRCSARSARRARAARRTSRGRTAPRKSAAPGTRQAEQHERDERSAHPLAPRRTERSEIRPARDETNRALRLPRLPAPTGPTPLERRRAYRYGGEVSVDRDLLYGRNAVAEAIRAGRRKVRLLLLAEGTDDRKTVSDLAALAAAHGVEVQSVARTELDRRAPGTNHQGVVAEVGPYPYADYDAIIAATRDNPNALILVLDSIQDPQNFGTLLRTAEAAGVTGVVIPEHRAVQVTPAVVNASAGAVEYLPVAMVTNLVRAVEQAKEAGAWVVAAEALPEAALPASADLTGPLVLVVGSEGHGVSRLLRETSDLTVRIPLVGKIGSLNAATAGSILLYEIVRQRQDDAALSDLVTSLSDDD